MSPRLKISSSVIERLSKLETNETTGCLYGLMYDGTLLVVGLSIEFFESEKHAHHQLLLNFPAEIELCGVVKFQDDLSTGTLVKEILQDVDITDNPLVMIINEDKVLKAHFLVHDKLEETKYEVLSMDELWKQFLHVRLNTVLPLVCEATINGVKNMMQNKRKRIASGQVSFHIDNTSVYLFGVDSDVGLTGTSMEATVGEILDSMSPEQPKKKKQYSNNVDILPVNFIMRATKDVTSEKLVKTAVKMMTTQRKPSFCITMPLRVDALALVPRGSKLAGLYTALVEAACRALRLLEAVLLDQLGQEGIGDGAGLRLPETFHFLPQELGHFVTRIVPKGIPDESMEKERKVLHEQFGLPLTRPVFRRGNAHSCGNGGGKLLNPHLALPAAPRRDVTAALVRGRYVYYHYLQDGLDDDGWGCAYRSLQTIFSWFRLQGYTTAEVPSHADMQRWLVALGDKPAAFAGSRQWLGSTELSFCLQRALGAGSRLLFARCAADLPDHTHDLLHHFEVHGSPVMIGGGVLAHTILGVEYNTVTNETRYLILDPHYTGPEDLATVVGKGWCGWKGADFWNKTAHYNLCLPLTKPAL